VSTNNIFSPANGKPVTTPPRNHPGSYYMNYLPRTSRWRSPPRASTPTTRCCALGRQANQDPRDHSPAQSGLGQKDLFGNATAKFIDTTAGRCIFNEVWPRELVFNNSNADKKALGTLVKTCFDVSAANAPCGPR